MNSLRTIAKLATLVVIGGGTIGAAVGITQAQSFHDVPQSADAASNDFTFYIEITDWKGPGDSSGRWKTAANNGKLCLHTYDNIKGDRWHYDKTKKVEGDIPNLYSITVSDMVFSDYNTFGLETYVYDKGAEFNIATWLNCLDKVKNGYNYIKVVADNDDNSSYRQKETIDAKFLGSKNVCEVINSDKIAPTSVTQRVWINLDDSSMTSVENAWLSNNDTNKTFILSFDENNKTTSSEVKFFQNDNTDNKIQRIFGYSDIPLNCSKFKIINTFSENSRFVRYETDFINNDVNQVAKINFVTRSNDKFVVETANAVDKVSVGVEMALKGLESFVTCSSNEFNGANAIANWKESFVGDWADLNIFDTKTVKDYANGAYNVENGYDLTAKRETDVNAGEKIRRMEAKAIGYKASQTLDTNSMQNTAIVATSVAVLSTSLIAGFAYLLKKRKLSA